MESSSLLQLWPTGTPVTGEIDLAFSLPEENTPKPYPKACVVCRDRKIKCDRQLPCSNCTRWGNKDCVYPPAKRRPRNTNPAKKKYEPEKLLLERLQKLEIMVQKLGGNITNESPQQLRKLEESLGSSEALSDEPLPTSSEKGVGKLVTKNSKSSYISPAFWLHAQEDGDLDTIIESDTSDSSDSDEIGAVMFPFSWNRSHTRWMHPSVSQKSFYWNIYCERVDPLVKILHKPSFDEIFAHEHHLEENQNRSLTVLLFAIYYSAVTSLTSQEVKTNLESDRTELLEYYKSAVERALTDAGFLATQEIETLQGFLLYLVCSRCHGKSKVVWSLTGLAVRLAQSMGLHRDGTKLGLSPLETETRRRLWWQIWFLDVRSSEDHGSESSTLNLDFDTRVPLNINDSDLSTSLVDLPEDIEGLTDSTFCVIRYEIGRVFCWIRDGTRGKSIAAKEKLLAECCERLETRYLKYCNDGNALQWTISNITHLVMDKNWFKLYYSPTWIQGEASMTRELRERLFVLTIKIVERSDLIGRDRRAEKWNWMNRSYFQWLPRAFILAELCNRDRDELVDRAWKSIDNSFLACPDKLAASKNGILLKRLMAKANAKRNTVSSKQIPNQSLSSIDTTEPGKLDSLSIENFSADIPAAWNQEFAPPQIAFTGWDDNLPETLMDYNFAFHPIYFGDWNYTMTDDGAAITYDGHAAN